MLKKLSFLSLILFVSACATNSSVADKDVAETGEQLASKENNDQQIICKRTQKVGTHFKTKQCWTKEDYEDLQEKSRQAIENAQGSSMTGPEGR
ncbi:hypothetical protein [Kangiella sp.]|uniref:hypothetical protein n=1 Tax=Kangiella sp. TaxID=1920245 RepID=UPI0019931EC8|nr:hypothetical protein [Kangiella sp.]MBD3652894.1 hypothetical protein [Kangiella sp.]